MTPDAWSKVLRTNLDGVRNSCHAAARYMSQHGGVIIIIGSGSGLSPRPGQVNYSTSKSAIVGLSRSLARELAGVGVRVLVIAPGFTDTEMAQAVSADAAEHSKRMIPMGRWGLPEEIAAVVAFAVSDAGSYLTGQTLVADGGRVALEQEFGFALGAPLP